ncbi:hypothetical protein JCM19037_4684 [Geomicrobium sp. JCM 19037]|uniref:hypothetical protein n=1 Tax=Geomicrobium sp. JCM 19037 TaxID=1460634 RepID=UPI00045F201E|nr:hypothetical protein [Geomicrobium sp. JCM 19037]GAK06112.1 hypothetical protein JCM19037_4684 [Geomicrobium sp. JCM 19037]
MNRKRWVACGIAVLIVGIAIPVQMFVAVMTADFSDVFSFDQVPRGSDEDRIERRNCRP